MFKAPEFCKRVQCVKNSNKSLIVFLICLVCACLGGCASNKQRLTSSNSHKLLPSWHKMKSAARDAATRVDTWLPAVGAVVVQVADADKQISHWAGTTTPVFGSNTGARDASDLMRDSNKALFYGSLLSASQGNNLQERSSDFLYDLGVGQSGILFVDASTDVLKTNVKRVRPNGNNTRSFPSHHTASAIAHGTMARRNIDSINMNSSYKTLLKGVTNGLGAATGWARVEGLSHYPSDVMAGAALANFTSHFMYNLFFTDKGGASVIVSPLPGEKGSKIEVQVPF